MLIYQVEIIILKLVEYKQQVDNLVTKNTDIVRWVFLLKVKKCWVPERDRTANLLLHRQTL